MTELSKLKALLVIAGVLMVAGCTYPTTSHHEIHFDGTVERIDGSFRINGQVDVTVGTAAARNFTNVRLMFYAENESMLGRTSLGPMSTDTAVAPTHRQVNTSSEQLPAYVSIESPDFWAGNLPVVAFRWTGDRYERYFINSRNERFQSNGS